MKLFDGQSTAITGISLCQSATSDQFIINIIHIHLCGGSAPSPLPLLEAQPASGPLRGSSPLSLSRLCAMTASSALLTVMCTPPQRKPHCKTSSKTRNVPTASRNGVCTQRSHARWLVWSIDGERPAQMARMMRWRGVTRTSLPRTLPDAAWFSSSLPPPPRSP
ncbi:unnamed protein product [Cutaneotrichosporon oleaginosum]